MLPQSLTRYKSQFVVIAALAFASAVCLALYTFRVLYSGRLTYFFLNWNLFLAWIPLLCAFAAYGFYARRSKLRYVAVAWCAGAWLLFFPNAPYMLTDLLHLQPTGQAPVWFDLVMLLAFALTGLFLGFASLYLMQDLVTRSLGRVAGWLLAVMALGLSGFGIYLGRFLRWNSWDVLFDPRGLAADVWVRLRHPLAHPQTFAFSMLFATFCFSAYLILFAFTRFHQAEQFQAR